MKYKVKFVYNEMSLYEGTAYEKGGFENYEDACRYADVMAGDGTTTPLIETEK